MSLHLRPYQTAAIEAIYGFLRNQNGNPCVVAPTGSGKGLMLAQVVHDTILRWNGRVLLLTHVRELIAQNAQQIRRLCPDLSVGIYSAGLKRRDLQQPVICAGIQSIYQRACEFDPFDLILIDEAHLISGRDDSMYGQFLADSKVINPAVRLAGFTATPYRLDSGLIYGPDQLFQDVCYEIGVRELIRDGYLSPLISKAGKTKIDTSTLHVRGGEFITGEVEDLMDGDDLVEAACREIVELTQDRQSVLIFASGIRHARHIQEVLQKQHNQECGFVSGETPLPEREELLARFRGESAGLFEKTPLKFLVNVGVLTTGFDAPGVDAIAILRPTMSPGLLVQMCLDMETEVLTSHGWARCHEVGVNDTVASFDLDTGEIKWGKALNKVHRPLAPGESMYAIQSPHLDVRVTNKHTMIYQSPGKTCKRWKTTTAEALAHQKDSYYVPIAGTNDGAGVALSDAQLEFLGWVLTDGHRSPIHNSVAISQSAKSPYHEAIRSTLKGCGFGYSVSRTRRTGKFAQYADNVVYTVPYGQPRGPRRHLKGWSSLAEYLNRPLLESLADISRRQLHVLLEAMHLGDGKKQNNVSWTPRTKTLCIGHHKFLADQLQTLCLLRGYRCNISTQRQATSWHRRKPQTQYLLHIRPQLAATVGGSNSQPNKLVKKRSRLQEVSFSQDEMVWCLTTELRTLVVRRNGKVSIVGNCGRGFRLHPHKQNCLILDYGGNLARHGPIDQIRANIKKPNGNGEAPAKECPECQSVIAAGYASCPDCGFEFPPPDRNSHDAKASEAGVLSGQVTDREFDVHDITYSVHKKRDAADDAPRSMRVEYQLGLSHWVSEWICFEHTGYARRKAVAWWRERSPDPVPETAERAVELAEAGALAMTERVMVRSIVGEQFDRIIGYELGPMPEPVAYTLEPFDDSEVPF